MEALAAFRLRLGDVLSEKHQNVVSLETGLSLLSRTNEDILKTNSSLLKERDALVGKVRDARVGAVAPQHAYARAAHESVQCPTSARAAR